MAEVILETEKPSTSWNSKVQYLLDKSSPHVLYRWIGFAVIMSIYCIRVYLLNGWFVVSYGLGIYLLNKFIGFLTPQVCIHAIFFYYCFYVASNSLTQMMMI